jgi:hypothetical protein
MSSLRSKARFAGRLFVLLAVPLFVLVAARTRHTAEPCSTQPCGSSVP